MTAFSFREWRKGVGSSEAFRLSKMVRSPKDSFIITTIFTGFLSSSAGTPGYWSISSSTVSLEYPSGLSTEEYRRAMEKLSRKPLRWVTHCWV